MSSYFPIPNYQKHVRGMAVVPTITVAPPAPQVNSGFAGRNTPDISLNGSCADDAYTTVYESDVNGWIGICGTSVASPMAAALVAEWNQELHTQVGFVNPALYATFTGLGTSPRGIYGGLFNDITAGNTGLQWNAVPGYDQTTGIGSINVGY